MAKADKVKLEKPSEDDFLLAYAHWQVPIGLAKADGSPVVFASTEANCPPADLRCLSHAPAMFALLKRSLSKLEPEQRIAVERIINDIEMPGFTTNRMVRVEGWIEYWKNIAGWR